MNPWPSASYSTTKYCSRDAGTTIVDKSMVLTILPVTTSMATTLGVQRLIGCTKLFTMPVSSAHRIFCKFNKFTQLNLLISPMLMRFRFVRLFVCRCHLIRSIATTSIHFDLANAIFPLALTPKVRWHFAGCVANEPNRNDVHKIRLCSQRSASTLSTHLTIQIDINDIL